MKNKKKLFLLISIIFFINLEKAFSDQFNFEAKEIQIKEDGKILYAKDGVKITSSNNIEIIADSFLYNKSSLTLSVEGRVEINDSTNNIKIFGKKFIYEKKNEKIFSETDVKVILDNKYNLDAKEITYLIEGKKITSNKKTFLTDNLGNVIQSDNFDYSISKGIFKSNKVIYTDNIGNKHIVDSAILNTQTNEMLGKDFEINFHKDTFGNSNNDPRLKGNALFVKNNETKISKGVFTTCKKSDKCPPWTLSAEEIVHNKVKKTMNYKNAYLKIYDQTVFYFPKFFHPDPTVKRQSGFLIPSFRDSSTLGGHLSLPYFKVISESKDLTFKPRFYSNNSILLNTEYRAINKNSKHITDFSIKNKESKESTSNSKTHFFSNSKFNIDSSIFESSDVELNIQRVSNDHYLKIYDIDSPLVTDGSTLNSFINFSGMNEDLFVNANLEVFEDTTKQSSTDRYEYIMPNIKIDKVINIDPELNGYLSVDTSAFTKQYNTNIKETSVINNLNFNSFPMITSKGFLNNYSLIIKNVNIKSKNSTEYKNKSELEVLTAGMFTSSYPLKKIDKNFKRFLTPKISFRYSPNNTKNINDEDRRIDTKNVYSFNRIQANDTVESGASITVGSDYLLKNNQNLDILKFGLATVFNNKENEDLPRKSTLGNKSSNIFGNLELKPSKYFNIEYNFSLDNDLEKSKYDLIKAEISVNNFVNSFEFLEETAELGSEGYWSNKTTLNISEQNSLSFNKRKYTKTNLNEYYNLIYQYKNDCLTAAVEYNKNFYSDGDLKPSEELFFSLTIIPFTKLNSPNVNN